MITYLWGPLDSLVSITGLPIEVPYSLSFIIARRNAQWSFITCTIYYRSTTLPIFLEDLRIMHSVAMVWRQSRDHFKLSPT
jgi:hypothetical protein